MIDLQKCAEIGMTVIELELCQAKRKALKNDQLFYFTINPTCQDCYDEAHHALTGEPITREKL